MYCNFFVCFSSPLLFWAFFLATCFVFFCYLYSRIVLLLCFLPPFLYILLRCSKKEKRIFFKHVKYCLSFGQYYCIFFGKQVWPGKLQGFLCIFLFLVAEGVNIRTLYLLFFFLFTFVVCFNESFVIKKKKKCCLVHVINF